MQHQGEYQYWEDVSSDIENFKQHVKYCVVKSKLKGTTLGSKYRKRYADVILKSWISRDESAFLYPLKFSIPGNSGTITFQENHFKTGCADQTMSEVEKMFEDFVFAHSGFTEYEISNPTNRKHCNLFVYKLIIGY